MGRADLHLHSTCSDGLLAPAAVTELVAARGLSALALTDHDSVEGLPEAERRAGELGLRFVPAIELSVVHAGWDLHLLAYFVDPTHVALRRHLELLRSAREVRLERMLERLARQGIDLPIAAVHAEAGSSSALGRMHVARALVATGSVPDLTAAFRLYLADGGVACVPKETPDLDRSFATLRDCGGVVSLAHPGAYRQRARLLGTLVPLGLAGLETVHPMHAPHERARFGRTAERWGLLPTGGSDYHGGREHEALPGVHCVEVSILDALEARRAGRGGAPPRGRRTGVQEGRNQETPMSTGSEKDATRGFQHARRLRFVAVFVVLASAIGWLVVRGARSTAHYYVDVEELLAMPAGAEMRGIRVNGHVEKGSVTRRDFDLTFRITNGSRSVPVAYSGVIPDTFAEEGEVVVEGRFGEDGTFRADFLMAKCPSKYEVDPDDMRDGHASPPSGRSGGGSTS